MISLIIIVKNDPRIARLLEKLVTISYPENKEIIVVDASDGALDYIKLQYPKVTWLDFIPSDKKRTYAEQRNKGVNQARGDIIVFIDADCLPENNWLKALVYPIRNEKEYIVSGACRPIGKNTIHKEEQYSRYREECETMNIAIKKEVFKQIGYFDENLEGCEDSDFCIRARKKGYKIRHAKEAVIYHDWGGMKKNIIRSYHGGKDRVNLYRKHYKHLKVMNSNNIYTLYYVFFILGLPIMLFFPWYIIVLFLPSIIKKRNPLKELYNLAFGLGVIRQFFITVSAQKRKELSK